MGTRLSALFWTAVVCLSAWPAALLEAQGEVAPSRAIADVRVFNLRTNDLIYDPVSQRIYASVPSSAGPARRDTIATINPRTSQIESLVFIGSDPGPLAVSDDGEYLYLGLNGEAAIRRFHIPSRTPGLKFQVGVTPDFSENLLFAGDMEVVPGNPAAVAVSRIRTDTIPPHYDVAIFDDGVMRPVTTSFLDDAPAIEFSESATLLYGFDFNSFGLTFQRFLVDANGLTTEVSVDDLINVVSNIWPQDMEFHSGLIYTGNGLVIDPIALAQVGAYPSGGPIAIDSRNNRIFFLNDHAFDLPPSASRTWTLDSFDLDKRVLLESQEIEGPSGSADRLITWGNGGVAFRTDQGEVYLFPEIPVMNDDVIAGFGPELGTWARMNDNKWVQLHARSPEAMATGDLDASGRSDVLIDFGPDLGVWKWMNNADWVRLHRKSPNLIVTGNLGGGFQPGMPLPIPDDDPTGVTSSLEIVTDVTLTDVNVRVIVQHTWVGDLKIVLRSPAGTEVVLLDRPGVPAIGEFGCNDRNMDVVFDDASGVDLEAYCGLIETGIEPWYVGLAAPAGSLSAFSGESALGTWSLIVSDNAHQDVGAIVNWQLFTEPAAADTAMRDDAVISFPSLGLWRWMNDSNWLKLHKQPAEAMAVGDLDGNGMDDVVVDFGSTIGLWKWMNNAGWVQLHKLSPELLVTGDLDGNGIDDAVVDFGSTVGLWRWMNNAGWVKLHALSPELLETGDLDGNGMDDVVVDFGATVGLWRWMNNASWIKLHSLSPELLVTGDLDNNGMDEIVVDFGATVGLWRWMNNSFWLKLHGASPEVMATGNLDGL